MKKFYSDESNFCPLAVRDKFSVRATYTVASDNTCNSWREFWRLYLYPGWKQYYKYCTSTVIAQVHFQRLLEVVAKNNSTCTTK